MKEEVKRAGIERSTSGLKPWQIKLYTIIFEAETKAGRFFDVMLLFFILLSVITVMLDSVAPIKEEYGHYLMYTEWFLTLSFTAEYVLRLACVQSPRRYATSFLGIIDFISIIPTYLSILFVGTHALIVIRIIRLLRVFIFKLANFLNESKILVTALKASKIKISVFIMTVICIVVIMGTVMYLIEGPANGFHSIPVSMYWAIVTLTTVGYGDIAPQTPLGQCIASFIMILGYGIIAVPTGIVTTQMVHASYKPVSNEACMHCATEGHDTDAVFCKMCGNKL